MKLSRDQKNLAEIASLVEYAFLKKNDVTKDSNFISRYEHSDGYGEFHHDTLESYVMVNNFKSAIFDRQVKMAGIGYVASYPENRGHGDITKIMTEVLQDLHHNDVALSNLAPWSETFYRQYGYENAIYQKIYDINPAMLRYFKAVKKGRILRGRWSDKNLQKLVIDLYRNQIKSGDERNTVIREKWWWDRFVTYYPGRYTAVYINEKGQAEAYMFYRIIDNTFKAEEFFFISQKSAQALLSFIGSHISSCEHFCIVMPEESGLEEYFPDQEGITITTRSYMMSRIIDFTKIIACMKISGSPSFNLKVIDDKNCPWNNGTWKVNLNNGNASCVKTAENADFSASITDWTKVLVGHLTLKEACSLDLVKRNSNKEIAFKKGRISFYDYF